MKAKFNILKADTLHIRYMYCRQCRNYQFSGPCGLKIEAAGKRGEALVGPVTKALEGIAWLPGTLKEIKAENTFSEKAEVFVQIYDLTEDEK